MLKAVHHFYIYKKIIDNPKKNLILFFELQDEHSQNLNSFF
jgi:hypothetical protein